MSLREEDDILRRREEHFDKILNIKPSNQNANSQEIYQANF
jgi:23S rRNA U2552 (ribose-2'-O)-methylase RlmE/FtsJ